MDGRDYRSTRATNNTHTFTVIGDNIYVRIPILNNRRRDGQRFFLFGITSNCGIRIWLQIFIWDDEQGKLIISTNAIIMPTQNIHTHAYMCGYTCICTPYSTRYIRFYVCVFPDYSCSVVYKWNNC